MLYRQEQLQHFRQRFYQLTLSENTYLYIKINKDNEAIKLKLIHKVLLGQRMEYDHCRDKHSNHCILLLSVSSG